MPVQMQTNAISRSEAPVSHFDQKSTGASLDKLTSGLKINTTASGTSASSLLTDKITAKSPEVTKGAVKSNSPEVTKGATKSNNPILARSSDGDTLQLSNKVGNTKNQATQSKNYTNFAQASKNISQNQAPALEQALKQMEKASSLPKSGINLLEK